MSLLFLIGKTLLVILFLVMFLRTHKPGWGIGLLTVTSAILLDTLLGTLGREQMLEDLGFFFYIIAGALLAGATIWLWAIMKEFVFDESQPNETGSISSKDEPVSADSSGVVEDENDKRRQILNQLHQDLSHDELFDLIFDLGWIDGDLDIIQREDDHFINSIIELAEERGQVESLVLASERIRTPIPPENLPRLEKLNQDTPPTLLRQFLAANYTFDQLERLLEQLEGDHEIIRGRLKKSNVRNLLTDLYQTDQIAALIELMQQPSDDVIGH